MLFSVIGGGLGDLLSGLAYLLLGLGDLLGGGLGLVGGLGLGFDQLCGVPIIIRTMWGGGLLLTPPPPPLPSLPIKEG